MPDIIELIDLTKVFSGRIVAVDNVSMNIREGEFVTLLGPSGCGKTTILRMIAGFEVPTAGRIRLAGEDMTDYPPYQRQVNMVFQDYALFPHMTVEQNVGYGLLVAGVAKAEIAGRVRDALTMVDLMDKTGDRPGQLSGGQKQRVALARALVREPKVLLLDEPLSALDAKLREAMQMELKHLHEELGLTFVYVTHDQTEALVMSDRVVVMDRGRIIQSGTPTDLYDRPESAYVADFIGSSNMITGQVSAVAGGIVSVRLPGGEIRSVTNGRDLPAGSTVTASIRPEKVMLLGADETAPEGFSVLEGVVRDRLFQGNVTTVGLDLDAIGGAPFMVEVHLRAASDRVAMPLPGSRARIAIDPRNVSTFVAEKSR